MSNHAGTIVNNVISGQSLCAMAADLEAQAKRMRKEAKEQARQAKAKRETRVLAIDALKDVALNAHIHTARIEAAKTLLALTGVNV